MNKEQEEEELQIDEMEDKNKLKILQEKENKIDIQLIIKTSIDQDIVDQMSEDQKYHYNQIETGFPYERQNDSFGVPQYKQQQLYQKRKLRIQIYLTDYKYYFCITRIKFKKQRMLKHLQGWNICHLNIMRFQFQRDYKLINNQHIWMFPIIRFQLFNIRKFQLAQNYYTIAIIPSQKYNLQQQSQSVNDRQKLLKILPYIDEIDDTPVSREERFHALEIFPNELQQYQERMNQRKKEKNSRVQRIQDIFDNEKLKLPKDIEVDDEDDDLTENSIKQLQEKTQQLVKRSKESMKQQIQEINKDVEEYRELHIKIREQIHENSLNNKYKNQ
ncbi:hypothetical protein pb186bvf_001423 [Paramecium bursaria]